MMKKEMTTKIRNDTNTSNMCIDLRFLFETSGYELKKARTTKTSIDVNKTPTNSGRRGNNLSNAMQVGGQFIG
jgi:hypothetical protein